MDTVKAFSMGEANRGNEPMVFDWDKAARLIVERKPKSVRAGLRDDWEWTGGDIFVDGAPVALLDTYVYLASTWATPEIEIDGQREPCYLMRGQTAGWDAATYWPESARRILGAAGR